MCWVTLGVIRGKFRVTLGVIKGMFLGHFGGWHPGDISGSKQNQKKDVSADRSGGISASLKRGVSVGSPQRWNRGMRRCPPLLALLCTQFRDGPMYGVGGGSVGVGAWVWEVDVNGKVWADGKSARENHPPAHSTTPKPPPSSNRNRTQNTLTKNARCFAIWRRTADRI